MFKGLPRLNKFEHTKIILLGEGWWGGQDRRAGVGWVWGQVKDPDGPGPGVPSRDIYES